MEKHSAARLICLSGLCCAVFEFAELVFIFHFRYTTSSAVDVAHVEELFGMGVRFYFLWFFNGFAVQYMFF